MSDVTKITDHQAQAKARLIHQFKGKPKIEGFLDAFTFQDQEIEDVFWDLLTLRTLENATGIQLDLLGDIVGESRQGRDDTDYRNAIVNMRIPINTAQGTPDFIQDLFALLTGSLSVQMFFNRPAEVELWADHDFTGINEIQDITFDAVPDTGSFTLFYNSEETAAINWNDDAAAVHAALNALPSLSGVIVTGDFSSGFTVEFAGDDGDQDQPLLTEGSNSLEASAVPVNISINETVAGVLPDIDTHYLYETMRKVVSAGVSIMTFGWFDQAGDEYFTFADDPDGLGFDDANSPGQGGSLSSLVADV